LRHQIAMWYMNISPTQYLVRVTETVNATVIEV
jgi:hypothetical protein